MNQPPNPPRRTSDHQVQAALDMLAIQQVITRYSLGQDSHQRGDNNILEHWDETFAPEATVDYSASGGPECTYRELANQMRGVDGSRPGRMVGFDAWQHMLSIPAIAINGDSADARTDFMAVHRVSAKEREHARLDSVGAFHDTLRRTEARTDGGWRIVHRRLEVYFTDYVNAAPAEEYS